MRRALLILAWVLSSAAQAGRNCDAPQPPKPERVAQSLALAERSARALDASGAELVLLGRAGQDLSKYGLRWSHLGFALREAPPEAGLPGRWRVVHKLNACGSDHAGLFRQGLGEFFLDDPHRFEVVFAPLRPEPAARLRALLMDRERLPRWHEGRYSVVSYAWGQRYQQSNQWLLETLAGALEPAANTRERAQAWLRLQGYQPDVLHINALTRLGGRMTRANVAFDDHPNGERYSGRIATVGADSVLRWAQHSGITEAAVVLR
jgi:hypothetical protein